MNAFNKRYFVWISLILLGFSAISFEIKNLILFPVFAIFLAVLYFILSKSRRKSKNLKIICVLLLVAAALGVALPRALILKNELAVKEYSGEHEISGYVSEVSTAENFISEYILHVEGLDGDRVNFDLVLVADYKCELSRGDFIKLRGQIAAAESYGDLIYLKNKNAYDYPLICSINDKVEIDILESEFRISLMLTSLNSKLSSTLKAALGKDGGSLASALLLGNRELLSDNTLRDFRRAGVYHMLALSGLHVAILIGIFEWILKKLCAPRPLRIVSMTFLSLFYIALTGFALSACRSMLMLWVMYLAMILGKKRDAMTSLFVAVVVIVLIDPAAILDVGLQLSFFSTFGVICASLISEKIKWFKKNDGKEGFGKFAMCLVRKFALINIASLCVFICTLPSLMIYFGEVSLATFVSNIFMGVVCEFFMVASLIALLLSFNPYLRFPFTEISVRVGEFMTETVSEIAKIRGVMLSLRYPRTEILVFALFFGFLLFLALRFRKKWLIFVPSIIFAVLLPMNIAIYSAEREGIVRAEYLSGDNLILSSANEVYICDASGGSYGALYDSVEIAKENCFTEIDGIILTHYHSRHIISLERLSKNFVINRVLVPMPQNREEDLIMRSLVRVLSAQDVEVFIYENGRELDILSGKLNVSPRAYIAGYAHPSVALSFAFGNERITIVGKPYFDTYLEESKVFNGYINNSDYLIFGADGRDVEEDFEIFAGLKKGCEISFAEFDFMNKSDFYDYLDDYEIYFDVQYKKYDLK